MTQMARTTLTLKHSRLKPWGWWGGVKFQTKLCTASVGKLNTKIKYRHGVSELN